MSPRRKVEPGQPPLLVHQAVTPRRRWRLPLMFAVAGLVVAEAITACVLILVSHESERRQTMRSVTVLTDVRSFMTDFTSLDPFHANDYVDGSLARATGEFARQYQEKANVAILAVAKAEHPTTGTVLEAGIERWNDDGSANVLVALEINAKSPDGKQTVDIANRWLVTAAQEGGQWKISSLIQVI